MTRLHALDPQTAPAAAAEVLEAFRASTGVLPNMVRVMANSPALLRGYLDLSGALSHGSIPASARERIALLIAEENSCDYCLSAHSYLAEHVAKLGEDEIAAARHAESADPRVKAMLQLASAVNTTRGDISERELADARAAGLTDGEIAEVIGHVALNVLTNYFNKAAGVVLDFPRVAPRQNAA